MGKLLERVERADVGEIDRPSTCLLASALDRGGGVVAEIDELERVEVGPAAPVVLAAP